MTTLSEFERLPNDGVQHELDEGELITTLPPKLRHSRVAWRIAKRLGQLEDKFGGEILVEGGFLLGRGPDTVRQPDVAYITADRTRSAGDEGYVAGAPDLAIEVASPSDPMIDLDRKVEQYLRAGSKLVWVVMPKHERIRIFRADGTSTVRHRGELLDAPELFPGWSMPVEKVFE